ncbi:hypothetical protein GCM10025856_15200 [Methylophaga marina]|nr:hypothetical protein [Methylophaga marina]BDZ73801.1 hypothetical protein GCM10025856_15200 [Methylophaga marina]
MARHWFDVSAKGWDRNAQFYLGLMSFNGDGEEKNLIEAYKWFDLAASSGHEDAHYYRSAVAAMLTEEQKKQASQLAQKWFDENHDTPHKHYNKVPHQH